VVVHNPSVPSDTVLPHLYYRDADAAARWLANAFGLEEVYRLPEDDGRIHIANLRLGAANIMIRYERDERLSPISAGGNTQSVMVIVDDVTAHHSRAEAAGADITSPPEDMAYGVREYSVKDLEGHEWSFVEQRNPVDPAELGGIVHGG
jgi:uncharacterized glyoxalase superfamily protein PhnB